MKTDEAVKFAWAFLIIHGVETTGVWSFYGGCWEDVDRYPSWDELKERRAKLREKVETIGIDFEKSGIPTVTNESGFLDTFADTVSHHTATLGKLVLKNGETIMLGSGDNEAAALVNVAKEMLATPNESEVEKLSRLL